MTGISVTVPDGVCGNWRVETFTVSEKEARFANINVRGYQMIYPGTYKRLMRGKTVVMSNTPMEVRTNMGFIFRARGNVLVNGLGLGMVLTAILGNPDVSAVTVIEKHAEVIQLVGPSFTDSRVSIIHADALEWKPPPGIRYDAVWHDIWDDITEDNLPDMKLLSRRYGRRANWQGCWAREYIRL